MSHAENIFPNWDHSNKIKCCQMKSNDGGFFSVYLLQWSKGDLLEREEIILANSANSAGDRMSYGNT